MTSFKFFYTMSFGLITRLWIAVEISAFHYQTCVAQNSKCSQETLQNEYIATVVEYKPVPIGNQTAIDALLSNIGAYTQLIEDAGQHDADIVVFPEYGITTIKLPPQRDKAREYFVNVPKMGTIPCDNNQNDTHNFRILYELSCAARMHKIYVVVNLGEIAECSRNSLEENCPEDGLFHYNTNIVFDRNGMILSRYRKFHLYFVPQFDYPELELSSFKTDFGVEFGMFTCFDIIFANPAVEMIASKGIRNFVFPTAWVDELPFLTAIQAQSMWAQSNKANLLASGYHQPDRGSMGSGIYSGQFHGALNYVFNPDSGTQLVVSPVPIYPNATLDVPQSNVRHSQEKVSSTINLNHFWLREDLTNSSYKTIDLKANNSWLCYNDIFCCNIEYEIIQGSEMTGEMKLIVFDGKRTVAAKTDWFEWQVCAIVHCLNETIESCSDNLAISPNQVNIPQISNVRLTMNPTKLEYEFAEISEPALSLLDSSFNLIPQTYFDIRQWNTENGTSYAQANSKNNSGIANVHIKTVALIQKVYGGRTYNKLYYNLQIFSRILILKTMRVL